MMLSQQSYSRVCSGDEAMKHVQHMSMRASLLAYLCLLLLLT
jgi:hypothetical protein